MNQSLQIREFTPADDEACRRLYAASAMSSYGPHLEVRAIVEDPAVPLEDSDLRLVAVEGGTILGYVALTGSHIGSLFVSPAAQGREIGRRLLEATEARIEGDVTLSVFTVNPRARAFYERHGYICTGTKTVDFHGVAADTWRMLKVRPSGSPGAMPPSAP